MTFVRIDSCQIQVADLCRSFSVQTLQEYTPITVLECASGFFIHDAFGSDEMVVQISRWRAVSRAVLGSARLTTS